jgi:hypothetical protein
MHIIADREIIISEIVALFSLINRIIYCMLLITYVNSSGNGKPFRSEGDVSRRIVVDASSEWAGAGHVVRE